MQTGILIEFFLFFKCNDKHGIPAESLPGLVCTLEHGADLPPGGHPALAGVLAQSCLQKEQREPTEVEQEAVWDEESTWKFTRTNQFGLTCPHPC